MPWPLLTAITVLLAIALQLWWMRRWRAARAQEARRLERARLEQRESDLQLRTRQDAMLNSMVEGLLVLNADGRIQVANNAFFQLFNLKPEVAGKTILEALRSHELDAVLIRLRREKLPVRTELRLPGPPLRVIEVSAAMIASPTEQGSVLVFHDITRLDQLERAREEFVANVSHELRTPLSMIKGGTETLLDGAADDPQVSRKFLSAISRNAERLEFLIQDLLTISELESGRLKLNLETVDLDAVIAKVLTDQQAAATARNISLKAVPSGLRICADAGRIDQVLCNLLDNGIKYGRQNGSIVIESSRQGEFVETCVRDDGPGIPSESLDRIFERFYRVDKARSRNQGGTGLGLSIVKHIVQSHGGKAWATSRVGEGSAFYFSIPAAK